MTSGVGSFRLKGSLVLTVLALLVTAAPAQAAPDRTFDPLRGNPRFMALMKKCHFDH